LRVPLHLGITDDGKKIVLPDDAVTEGFADFGQRGTGKSNLLAVVCEVLAARKHSFVILDPPDAHWGIRYEAGEDGQPCGPSGFDVLIVGGEHGDVPLNPEKGKELANIIVDGDISAVICMRGLSYTAQQRFAADFGEELFRINRTPRFIGFEEAHNFLPQNLKFEEQKRVLYAMDKFIAEGRGSGLGFMLASQRLSKVNKDALEEVHNFFALRLVGPNDLKQIEGWLQHHVKRDKERLHSIIDDIAQMESGECWFLSPVWLKELVKLKIRRRVTYHSGRTPKPGERTVSLAKFTVTEAVDKLKKLFAQKSVAIQTEVADLREAKARIRELERQVKTQAKAQPAAPNPAKVADPRAIERAVRPLKQLLEEVMRVFVKVNAFGFEKTALSADEITKALEKTAAEISRVAKSGLEKRYDEFEHLKRETNRLLQKLQAALENENVTVNVDIKHNEPITVKSSGGNSPVRPRERISLESGELTPYQVDILAGLALLEAIGRKESKRALVAAAAGKAVGSSTFEKYVARLRSDGLIEYGLGTIRLSERGRAVAPISDESLTSEELHRKVLALFTPYQQSVVRALIAAYPEALTREQLGERAGLQSTSSTFEKYVAALRSAEVLEYPDKGHVKASDWLFLE
jgi:HAMP domain-containing protein